MITDWWLSTVKMTFWCRVTNNIVTDTAPIARKFIGQPYSNLAKWLAKQGGFMWEQIIYET